jgi:hypothetical protein
LLSNKFKHPFHELAMYPPYAEEASAKKFLTPRCFTKFSPLKECDVHPADTDTRASGRAGSPALAKVQRVKDQAAWNRSTRRAEVRGGARAGRPRCVRILAWAGESVFFDILLTALTKKHGCERLLISKCAKVRSWPYPVVHPSIENRVQRSAPSSKAAVRLCRPWTSLVCLELSFVILGSGHWRINLPARKVNHHSHHARDDLFE